MTALRTEATKPFFTPFRLAILLIVGSLAAVAVVVATILGFQSGSSPAGRAYRQLSDAEIEALAPLQLAGLGRQDVRVEATSGTNVAATALDAKYEAGARRIDLKIVHSPDLDQVVGFGGAQTSGYDRTSGDGYQKRWREADVIFVESLDRKSGAATYGQVRGDFYVMTRGKGVSIEELRAAVSQVGDGALRGEKSGG